MYLAHHSGNEMINSEHPQFPPDSRFISLGQGYSFDRIKHCFASKKNASEIFLSAKEGKIFTYFLEHKNTLLTREELIIAGWNNTHIGYSSLTKAISNIRKAISTVGNLGIEIQTTTSVGYMMIVDVVDIDEPIGAEIAEPYPLAVRTGREKLIEYLAFRLKSMNSVSRKNSQSGY